MSNDSKRRIVIIGIMAFIAAIHVFRLGSYLPETWFNLYKAYFSDLVLPFGGYFLICASEQQIPLFRNWKMKFAVAFLIPSVAESCQYFGIPILGATFDPMDYIMFALGASLAAFVDLLVFPRLFRYWSPGKAKI